MNRLSVVTFAVAFAAFAAWSATHSGGSGDISTDAFWGGKLPAADEAVEFTSAAGNTYTLGSDATFGAMTITKSATFDFASGGDKTLNLASFNTTYRDSKIGFVGGVWNVSGNFWLSSSSGGSSGNEVTLSDGCKLTVGGTPRLSHKCSNQALRITDGSSMTVKSNFLLGVNATPNNTLEISSGGTLTFTTGRLMTDTPASAASLASSSNHVVVTGTGSKLDGAKCNNDLTIGNAYAGNDLLVTDGGEVDLGDRGLLVGNGIYSTGNRVTVSDGGTLKASQINLVYPDNRLMVSNATVRCTQVQVGTVTDSHDCDVTVKGSDTVYVTDTTKTSRYPAFTYGHDHSFTLDGATWSLGYNLALDVAASNCVFRMLNGSVLDLGGGVFPGTNHLASTYNTVEVTGGSAINGAFFTLSRHHNTLVVSNGTVNAVAETYSNSGIGIGRTLLNVDPASIADNRCVLKGDRPLLNSAKATEILNGSTLRFEIPEGGYLADHVPVLTQTFTVDANSALEFAGVAAFQQAIADGRRKVLTLVRASSANGISIPADVLAAANAALAAEGCRKCVLSVNDAKTELVLKVPGNGGLMLIFR